MSRNDITGDEIKTKGSSKAYEDSYDKIFRKVAPVEVPTHQSLDNAEQPCKTHPEAPHGFARDLSHSLDRYVCECEGWDEGRMDVVGQNGPTGDHYEEVDKLYKRVKENGNA